MTALSMPTSPQPTEDLFRTPNGKGLHLAVCPHLHGTTFVPATADDREALPVCEWSQKELDGVGRTYFQTLDDAMRFFGTHVGDERTIRDALRSFRYDEIWVPHSGSYIALGLAGLGVAWVGKTYVVPARGLFEEFPGYAPGGRGGAARGVRPEALCPTCRLALPRTGICDDCG